MFEHIWGDDVVEFHDVHQRSDGTWAATHTPTGREITAPTLRQLHIAAMVVRISHTYRLAFGDPLPEGRR